MTYKEQLADSRWLKRKFPILERDNFKCTKCGSTNNLNVHHIRYIPNLMAWEYPDESLITLCQHCHEREHNIVSYPKVGNFYCYQHSDFENDMLCYHIDTNREIVYLFGIDNGAFGTPQFDFLSINEFMQKFINFIYSK